MKKYLSADKTKDGYIVKITTLLVVSNFSEVKDIIRYEGLKMNKKFSEKDERGKYTRIFAE